jgi:small neutral amino acid transporter SnatA (MarC family)
MRQRNKHNEEKNIMSKKTYIILMVILWTLAILGSCLAFYLGESVLMVVGRILKVVLASLVFSAIYSLGADNNSHATAKE